MAARTTVGSQAITFDSRYPNSTPGGAAGAIPETSVQSIASASATASSVQSIATGTAGAGTVRFYVGASVANATKRAYQRDLAAFVAWGGGVPATPALVATYLADVAPTLSPYTLARRLVAISRAHRASGYTNPCSDELVGTTLAGIRRTHGTAQRQVSALVREDLFALLGTVPNTTKGYRDRALLLVGFAGAFRRSELIQLNVKDVAFVPEGVMVTLRASKTDQEGVGRKIGIPFARSTACPVKALQVWLEHSKIESGPIFRTMKKGGAILNKRITDQSVALIVKHYAGRAGLNPKNYSGHSLRAGLVTSAAKLGVSTWKIRQQTGHRSEAMLLRYVRDANLFVDNAAGYVL